MAKEDKAPKEAPKEAPKKPPKVMKFGDPDWIEKHVIPLGERGAKLWRSLNATHKDNRSNLRRDWEKFSKDVESWEELPREPEG